MARASPTAIKSFQKCPRQWAFKYLGNFPKIDRPWFRDGIEFDRYVEAYLKTGARPDWSTPMARLFHEGVHLLPSPGVASAQVALSWHFAGHEVYGFADFVVADPSYLDGAIVLGDTKTTGNSFYDLTEATLPRDAQAIGYAGALFETLEIDRLVARWIYHDKKKIRARPVDVPITRERNDAVARETILPALDGIDQVREYNPRTVAEINEIPNNPKACDGCGRHCDFATHCRIYTMNEPKMSLKDRIAALQTKTASAQGLAPEAMTALVETAKEIAVDPVVAQGTAPAPAPAPPARRGRKPKAEGTSETADVGALIEAARDSGGKVTITIEL